MLEGKGVHMQKRGEYTRRGSKGGSKTRTHGQRAQSQQVSQRAQDHWAGAAAVQPQHIPPKGWVEILRRVKQDLDEHNVSLVAAGIAFYALLSLFPLLIAMVSIYSMFADPSTVEAQLAQFSDIIPVEAQKIITEQLRKIVENSSATLGWSSLVSILVALWSGNKGTLAMMEGFNIAYGEREQRGVVKKYAIALGLSVGAIGFLLVALAFVAIMPAVLALLRLDAVVALGLDWGRWLVLAVILVLGLALVNRYAPSRNKAKWSWVSVGSVVSTILWMIVSAGFSFYVSHFGSYNETYGSLGGVVVLLLWLFLSCFVILLGAEINAHAELQTRRDTTRGREKPLGDRGANKADHTPKDAYSSRDVGRDDSQGDTPETRKGRG